MIDLLKSQVEKFFNNSSASVDINEINECLNQILTLLNKGQIRAAEKIGDRWQVNHWVKQAILLVFRFKNSILQPFDAFDKIGLLKYDLADPRYRKIPPAAIRNGSYIGSNVVVMPSYINIGAYIDDGSTIDINAVVGSCAQIGKNCHIAAQSCIGGVLEPVSAVPVIIEDNCFIGVHSSVLEGVIVKEGSVIAPGVNITASTKIIDRESQKTWQGIIPTGAVIVPGTYNSNGVNIACGVLIKMVDQKTKTKTAINEILHG
jgi:2,3,4,5-tetrahydropyridine-2-carboxylate N-succinyltransferase